jgi:hypothetical protein
VSQRPPPPNSRGANDEPERLVAEAEAHLERLAATTLRGDPYPVAVGALVMAVKAIGASVRSQTATFAGLVDGMRQDILDNVLAGAVRGMAGAAQSVVRTLDRRAVIRLAAVIALAFVGGAAFDRGIVLLDGSQFDAAAARFYAAMPICRAR